MTFSLQCQGVLHTFGALASLVSLRALPPFDSPHLALLFFGRGGLAWTRCLKDKSSPTPLRSTKEGSRCGSIERGRSIVLLNVERAKRRREREGERNGDPANGEGKRQWKQCRSEVCFPVCLNMKASSQVRAASSPSLPNCWSLRTHILSLIEKSQPYGSAFLPFQEKNKKDSL